MADETLSEKFARYNVALQLDGIPAEVTAAAKLHTADVEAFAAGQEAEDDLTLMVLGLS